jgi:autotransporter-associated beta strand protein
MAAAFCGAPAASAQLIHYTWNGAVGSSWTGPSSWNGGSVPPLEGLNSSVVNLQPDGTSFVRSSSFSSTVIYQIHRLNLGALLEGLVGGQLVIGTGGISSDTLPGGGYPLVPLSVDTVLVGSQSWSGRLNVASVRGISGETLTLHSPANGISEITFQQIKNSPGDDGHILVEGPARLTLAGAAEAGWNGTISAHTTAIGPGSNLGSTVHIQHGAALGAGTLQLHAHSTLLVNSTLTLPNTIRGSGARSLIEVEGAGQTLTLTGALTQGAGGSGFAKRGAGQLHLTGGAANTFTGAMTVEQGTLLLERPAGDASNNFGGALRGDLVIQAGALAVLRNDNQVDNTRRVSVLGGSLDLSTFQQGIGGGLELRGGTVFGAGGRLNLLGGLSTLASASSAVLDANLDRVDLFGGTRTFDVADGAAASDLFIATPLRNGAIVKSGAGRMEIAAPSDTSHLAIHGGEVRLNCATGNASNQFGGALYAGGVTIHGGGTLTLLNAHQIADGQPLHLAGGTLNLHGHSESVNPAVQFTGGTIGTSHAGGRFIFGGGITVNPAATSATITADFDFNSGIQTVAVADGAPALDLLTTGRATSAAFLIAKTGAGTWQLEGDSNFGGAIIKISEGRLRLAHGGSVNNAPLSLGGGTLAFGADMALGNGILLEGDSALDTEGHAVTLTGSFSTAQPTRLTKAGGGTLTLASGGDILADISVSAGVLRLAQPAGGPANNFGALHGTVAVLPGATLRLGANDQVDDSGRLHIAGGALDLAGFSEGMTTPLEMTGGTLGNSQFTGSKFNLLGGLTTHPAAASATITVPLDLFGASRPFTIADGPAAGDAVITGEIRNGTLDKRGPGTLVLGGAHTYAGPTFVAGGTLLVNGSLSGATTTVLHGATLGGSGTLTGVAIEGGGTLAPGNSTGILTTGDLTLGGSAVLSLELASAAASDRVNVNGSVLFNGPAVLVLTLSYDPLDYADSFTLIANDGSDPIGGRLWHDGIELYEGIEFRAGGQSFLLSYTGGDGNDLTLLAVPEPACALLLLAGLPLLARRRSSSRSA